MKKLFIILAVKAFMFGCTERQHSLIRQAWETIEDRPDSVKAILAEICTDSLTEGDKAEYGLLKTMVICKTHGIAKNDSLISASIAYYNQHGDDWHRGCAYFYRGAIRDMLNIFPGAIIDFKTAETISKKTDDNKLKHKTYMMLFKANLYSNNYPQTLKYAHKLLDCDIELNDSMMILRSLIRCATAHSDIGQADSACAYMEKALKLTRYADSLYLANIFATAATIYQEHGDVEKAVTYLKKWEETDVYNYIGYLSEARIRKAQGEYEKAIKLAKMEMGLPDCDQKTRMKCMELLSEIYELTDNQELASEARMQVKAYEDSMRYVNQTLQMAEWQQKFDEVQQTKDFYRRTSWMQGLIIALIVIVALAIGVGMLLHRRKVRKLSFRLDEDAMRISELRTNIEQLERSGAENGQEMARMKEELESRMERISGTLLVGTQMYSQLQQRQCIAEATAKEQQCLVDYFAQLRPKRWQEWERKYSGLSTAQYIFLIMQDDLHFDDETIAAILDVKRVSVRSMRARIKKSER